MIDLEKLGKKFEDLFAKETPESFEQWLKNRHNAEVQCQIKKLLGNGYVEDVTPPCSFQFKNSKTSNNLSPCGKDTLSYSSVQYSTAA